MFFPPIYSTRLRIFGFITILVVAIFCLYQIRRLGLRGATKELGLFLWRILISPDFRAVLFFYGAGLIIGTQYSAHLFSDELRAALVPIRWGGRVPGLIYGHWLGIVMALVFGLFRLGMNQWLSYVLGMLMLLSSLQLYILILSPGRDFLRARFVLAIIFCLGLLLKYGSDRKKLHLLICVLAFICGWGSFYREDIVTFLVPIAMAVFFLVQCRMRFKFEAFGILLFVFALTANRPLIRFNAVNTVAGLMTPLGNVLHLSRPPYDVGYLFLDEHIEANAQLAGGRRGAGEIGQGFFKKYLALCPSDMFTRLQSSVLQIIGLAFTNQLPPIGMAGSAVRFVYGVRSFIQATFKRIEVPIFLLVLFILALSNIRYFLLYCGVLLFVSVQASVQFWAKNYFYLEFLGWWNLGFLVQKLIGVIKTSQFDQIGTDFKIRRKRYAISFGCVSLLVLIMVLPGPFLRKVQNTRLQKLFNEYQSAARIDVTTKKVSEGRIVWAPGNLGVRDRVLASGGAQFYAAKFGGRGCKDKVIWPVLRYKSATTKEESRLDWSRTVPIEMSSSVGATFYFPAWPRFMGIEISKTNSACLLSLSRISPAPDLPLLMSVQIPWGLAPLNYELYYLKRKRVFSVLTVDSNDWFGEEDLGATSLLDGPLEFQSPIVQVSPDGWIVKGYSTAPVDIDWYPSWNRNRSFLSGIWSADVSVAEVDTDLLWTSEKAMVEGDLVLLRGELSHGGFSAGLITGKNTGGNVSVTSPGPFEILLRVPRDGKYRLGLANKVFSYTSLENRFIIRSANWIRSPRLS